MPGFRDSHDERNWKTRNDTIYQARRKVTLKMKPELKPIGVLCLDCNKIRTEREFQGVGERFENCAMCRGQGKPARRVK